MSGRPPASSSATSAPRTNRRQPRLKRKAVVSQHRQDPQDQNEDRRGAVVSDLVTALGLVLVIEGVLLALMPDLLKRLVAEILTQPTRRLRLGGLVSAAIGLA